MKRFLRWSGIVLGGLIVLLILAVGVLYIASNVTLATVFPKPAESITAPIDAQALARGEYLFGVMGCDECHGANGAGTAFIDNPALGYLPAPNLTAGAGGIGSLYTSDTDYANALRHGIRPDGTSLLIMPAEHYYFFNDADTGSLIAYIKALPPVDADLGTRSLGVIGRLLVLQGEFTLQAAMVAQNPPRPAAVPQGVTVEHGGYLANQCIGCHGLDLKGGVAAGEAPINAPGITGSSALINYTKEEFITAMRTGMRPGGGQIGDAMPWRTIGKFTDDDLSAMYLYLSQLPAEGRTAPGQ
jgi:mono/diheme cytochrome c family protein